VLDISVCTAVGTERRASLRLTMEKISFRTVSHQSTSDRRHITSPTLLLGHQ